MMEKKLTERKHLCKCVYKSKQYFFCKACIFLADLQQEYGIVHQLRRCLWYASVTEATLAD